MANRLAQESSPYLLQHAQNPVDWYPWGPEALEKARNEDKPILLSIGYSSCHWCHVMAHESFENDAIAALMNELFVNIKVDREERPDLDSIYMLSVQVMSGHGGWPMTVFLTPAGKPFYGGTYYPPSDRGAQPGLPRILQGVAEAYRDRRDQVEASAAQLTERLDAQFRSELPETELEPDLIRRAVAELERDFDATNGGFGGAPKFPAPMAVELLFRAYTRFGEDRFLEMAEQTLDHMARGGLYDQIGGGFHRYTVDTVWLVPHFEKMLYDNAQLAHIYTLAYQITDEPFYKTIAEETLAYVIREMTAENGGFYSTQDADTEGEEGKFFVWTPDEIRAVLGSQGSAAVITLFDLTERGNFEGSNILSINRSENRLKWRSPEFTELRKRLADAREQRIHPGRDQKILTSWNGMMMRAFATAAWVFNSDEYADIARRNARFLRDNMYANGKLRHVFNHSEARIDGFLEDYAFLIDGLLTLYQATFENEWAELAVDLARTAIDEFYDPESTSFFDTGGSALDLIARPRDAFDNATPSGNSVIAESLIRLAHLTGEIELDQIARSVLAEYANIAAEHPSGFARLLSAADLAIGPTPELAIVSRCADAPEQIIQTLRKQYLPRVIVAGTRKESNGSSLGLLRDRTALEEQMTVYVCVNHTCRMPTTDVEEMNRQLDAALLG